MKRLIKANTDFNETVTDRLYRNVNMSKWEQEDLDLHKSIDWEARNYEDYPVPEDSFEGDVVRYSIDEPEQHKNVKFIKYLRSNPIYPPYYKPETRPFSDVVGPMYDGDNVGKYGVHNRYETQELYNKLSM